ncbi:fibrinogen-binding adhesin SdrG C-terminal domain-containing protein, partial [Aerococcaceae bacterium DSM 111020]|nr:fibrinogen-binding adhesin SdrG C-terminal domain-containing protein [Aerococcaceae bacterium DSM 111020]
MFTSKDLTPEELEAINSGIANNLNNFTMEYTRDQFVNAMGQAMIQNKYNEENNIVSSASLYRLDTGQADANVNDLVNIYQVAINPTTFDPNQSGFSELSADFVVGERVQGGDYFTVSYPEKLSLNGDISYDNSSYEYLVAPLTNISGDIIANGVYDTQTKVLTYTFTDYVNDKTNIVGNFTTPIFADRQTTPNSESFYATFDLAGDRHTELFTIDYSSYIHQNSYGVGSTSMIFDVDTDSGLNEYRQVIYVNPQDRNLYQTYVNLYPQIFDGTDSSGQVNSNVSDIKVYRVPSTYSLNESYHVDETQLNEVFPTVSYGTNADGEYADIFLGNISDPYVIILDSQFEGNIDPTSINDLKHRVRTSAQGIAYDSYYGQYYYTARTYHTWDNFLVLKESSGVADGTALPGAFIEHHRYETVDQNGNVLSVDEELTKNPQTGLSSETYTTTENPRLGYELVAVENPINSPVYNLDGSSASGNFESGVTKEVTYVYQMVQEPDLYSIGDYVWNDANRDGFQDVNEVGIPGVVVILRDSNDNLVNMTITDENGNYRFDNLEAGDYTVKFASPGDDYIPTTLNAGADDSIDSDGFVVPVTLTETDLTIDSGFYREDQLVYEMIVEDVPFETIRRFNPNLPFGEDVVVQSGTEGQDRVIYIHEVVSAPVADFGTDEYFNNYFTEVDRIRLTEPRQEIIEYGVARDWEAIPSEDPNNPGTTVNEYYVNPNTGEQVITNTYFVPGQTIEQPQDGNSITTETVRGEGPQDPSVSTSPTVPGTWIYFYTVDGEGNIAPNPYDEAFVPDGQDGQDGEDGESPTATVVDNGDGTHTVTIVNPDGTTTETIIRDGQDGTDGADGQSPTVEVVDNGDGTHTVTIVNPDGTTTETIIRDGQDGTDGADGQSPTVEVVDNGDGTHTVTIVNPDGTTTETIIRDGEDGESPTATVVDNGDGTHTVTIVNPDGTTTETIIR